MLYVQLPSALRAQWGLRSNPSLKGTQIDVTGALTAYFSHAGLKITPPFVAAGGTEPTPDPDPEPGNGEHDDYYASALGKTGEDLRAELHTIISAQTKLSYSAVWEALKLTDQDPNNTSNVLLFYSARSQSKSTNGGDPDDWHREHVWAKRSAERRVGPECVSKCRARWSPGTEQ